MCDSWEGGVDTAVVQLLQRIMSVAARGLHVMEVTGLRGCHSVFAF